VKQHRPTSLLQRFATVDEIANMVVYLASKEAFGDERRGAPGRRRHHSQRRLKRHHAPYAVPTNHRFSTIRQSASCPPSLWLVGTA